MEFDLENPLVSVVIPSYDINELEYLDVSINSVLDQDYENYEVIIITEGKDLKRIIEKRFSTYEKVKIHQIENDSGGVSRARNAGIEKSVGDIIAYLDSDAYAEPDWLYRLVNAYKETDAIAVGGKAVPTYEKNKPWYLPDEFLWLVGVTHRGHPEHQSYIRSSFGCNMSFRADVIRELGGFDENLGKNHGYNLQGEEPELGIRLEKTFGEKMYYDERASVAHTVSKKQLKLKWLSKRAYLQGRTKAAIEKKSKDDSLSTEKNYLSMLLFNSIPRYFKNSFISRNRAENIGHLFSTVLFMNLVFIGYLEESLKRYLYS